MTFAHTADRPGLLARRPELLLVFVTLIWGSTFAVTKDIVRTAPPLAYLAVRFTVASLVMLALVPRALRAGRALYKDAALLGSLQALGLILQVFAQCYTTASKTSFVTALSTALTPLAGLALHRERPSLTQAGAVAIATVGLCLLTYPQAGAAWNRGDLFAASCALVYALVIVETARRARGKDALAFAAVQTACAGVCFVLACAAAHAALALVPASSLPEVIGLETRRLVLDGKLVGQLTYMSLICTVGTFFAQTWAMSRMAATHAAVVFALEPVFATGMAIALEGSTEWPGARGAAGAALVLCGVVAAELGRSSTNKQG